MAVVDCFDLLVVGGGINGAGIARDAAGRGLKVALVERDDFAQHTSSASTKLIHGGLRYLERFAFRLVQESLEEREVLLRIAPHLVRPMEFVIAPTPFARPMWMVRAGLYLYDRLGGRSSLPRSRILNLGEDVRGKPLRRHGRAAAYWDCWVDDSRLVILNLVDAAERGCAVWPRTEVLSARRADGGWIVELRDATGQRNVRAAALINATGPWVSELAQRAAAPLANREVRLVKGSHIVIPRLYSGEHAYLIQGDDHRVVFTIPYLDQFTLVGTTDVAVEEPVRHAVASPEEISYLLKVVAGSFRRSMWSRDVLASFAGVRPLQDDGSGSASAVTRDYSLKLDRTGAPLMNVIGGKLTTYRRLAEKVLDLLRPFFPQIGHCWTATAALPGGDFGSLDTLVARLHNGFPALPKTMVQRMAESYGNRTFDLLADSHSEADLGFHFGAGLYAREIDYLVRHEWAREPEDILRRRSKLSYQFRSEDVAKLDYYLTALVS